MPLPPRMVLGNGITLETWDQVRHYLLRGSPVFYGDLLLTNLRPKTPTDIDYPAYDAKDRYLQDCVVFEDGRVAYPAGTKS